MKQVVKLTCELEIPYESYSNLSLYKKAEKSILNWIKGMFIDCFNIPLYIEKDDDGSYIEDCTGKIKVCYISKK